MKRLLLLMATGLMGVALYAQESSSQRLSFEDAVKIGLEKNVTLKQQKNLLITSHAQKLGAIGSYIPSVNLTGGYQRQGGQQQNTTSGNLENLTTDYVGLQANANLTLFNGLARLNTVKQTDRAVTAQNYQVKKSGQDVIYNVASQYLQVLLDQELLRIAEENYRAQQVLLEKIQASFDVGAKAITDVHVQDALAKLAEVTAIRARSALQNDKSILAQTLQLDPSQNFEAVYPQFDEKFPTYDGVSLDSLIDIAIENRPDLQQAGYTAQANKFNLRSVTGQYLPTIALYANYGSFWYSQIDESFRGQFQTLNPSWTLGANLTIPIFTQFRSLSQHVSAKMTYQNSLLTKQNLETTVKLDVQRAYNNYMNAVEAYNASISQFQAGELALQTQQESYLLGVSDQAALAQANQTYVLGASSKVQAEVTLLFQKVLLEYALGVLREDQYTGAQP